MKFDGYEVRPDHRGEVDEVIVPDPRFVHFEKMDDDALWCAIKLPDGRDLHFDFWVTHHRKRERGRKRHRLKYRAEIR